MILAPCNSLKTLAVTLLVAKEGARTLEKGLEMRSEQEGVTCFLPNHENEGFPSEQQLRQTLEA